MAKNPGNKLCGKEMCRAFFIQKPILLIRAANLQKRIDSLSRHSRKIKRQTSAK
jgi:hypothetical protein